MRIAHAMAAFALAEACAVRSEGEHDRPGLRTRQPTESSSSNSSSTTTAAGGTPSRSKQPSDTSVSGWATLALKSAREAERSGQPEDARSNPLLLQVVRDVRRPDRVPNREAPSSDALAAVGMLTHLLLLKIPTCPWSSVVGYLAPGQDHCDRVRGGDAEFYTLYNATLAMYQAGGDNWNRWNDAVRDAVVAEPVQGPGCERGSWDPKGTFGGTQGGRIYSTALATLMLEVYYRFSRVED